MIFVFWIEVNEPSENSAIPRLKVAYLVRLDDDLHELESVRINGYSSGTAFDEEILRDWKPLFEKAYAPIAESKDRVFIFPHSKHRNRFYYMKSKCGFRDSHDTRNGSLGALLVAGGERLEAGAGITKMVEILGEYGIDALIAQGYLEYSKGQRSRREGIFSNEGFQYFGDLGTNLYHLRTCERLNDTKDSNLTGLGKNPASKGWLPCTFCIKESPVYSPTKPSPHSRLETKHQSKPNPLKPLQKLGWERQIERVSSRSALTKAQIIKRELTKVCEEYGMHAEYIGGTVFVTTAAGEWFFDYNDRPIRLHHKNYTENTKHLGRSLHHYHLQDRRFASPLHTLQYISEHDLELKRRTMQEAESEMVADDYFFGESEMNVVNKAIAFVAKAHDGDVCKGTTLPYIIHPAEVVAIAASITDDLEVIAAAALHDVLEDTDTMAAQIQIEFGARIRKLVEGESENKRQTLLAAGTCKVRKQEIIDYLHDYATTEERIIVLADSLSNIRACWRRYQSDGDAIWAMWAKSGMPDGEAQEWYYKATCDALGRLQDTDVWQEFNNLVNQLFAETPRRNSLDATAEQAISAIAGLDE